MGVIMRVIFSRHARQRLFERGISAEAAALAAQNGQPIISYDDDKPYSSRLVLGYDGTRPLHVLVAENVEEDALIVVTAYEPSAEIWQSGWTQRKRP